MRWFASSSPGRSSERARAAAAGRPGLFGARGVAGSAALADGAFDEPLLGPALLGALSGLDLVSAARRRRPNEGIHPALRHGREEEFFQHRPYVRGDDLRAVDWRASARTGHPLLKERHQPSRRPLTLLVDASASMEFPVADAARSSRALPAALGPDDRHGSTSAPTKLRQAKVLAAALAFLALRRGDSVEVLRLDGGAFANVGRLRPAPRALHAISAAITPIRAGGTDDVGEALLRFGSKVSRQGLIVVLSDLYGDEGRILDALRSIRRVAEVVVVHVLAAEEREIPRDLTALEELEGGTVVSLDATAVVRHAARVAEWRDRLRVGAGRAGAEWVDADAAEPAARVLTRWLARAS